jgi:hypothetical protein
MVIVGMKPSALEAKRMAIDLEVRQAWDNWTTNSPNELDKLWDEGQKLNQEEIRRATHSK